VNGVGFSYRFLAFGVEQGIRDPGWGKAFVTRKVGGEQPVWIETLRVPTDGKKSWAQRYRDSPEVGGRDPARILVENLDQLPRGQALDVAMGEGRNALFLAQHGYQVLGVERESLAIERAREKALERGLRLETLQVDLEKGWLPPPESFDLILVINYLQRSLWVPLQKALRPGGAVVMETQTVDAPGTMRREFRLGPNELLSACRELEVKLYREQAGRASLIAQRVDR